MKEKVPSFKNFLDQWRLRILWSAVLYEMPCPSPPPIKECGIASFITYRGRSTMLCRCLVLPHLDLLSWPISWTKQQTISLTGAQSRQRSSASSSCCASSHFTCVIQLGRPWGARVRQTHSRVYWKAQPRSCSSDPEDLEPDHDGHSSGWCSGGCVGCCHVLCSDRDSLGLCGQNMSQSRFFRTTKS